MKDTEDLSARVTILQEIVLQWEDHLQSGLGEPEMFRQAVAEFRAAVDGVGRAGFQQLVQACEVADDTLVRDGRVCRFKQAVDKEWMTLWGKVVVSRRQYQPDRGGASVTPLDERCGMVDRFVVPELERVTASLCPCGSRRPNEGVRPSGPWTRTRRPRPPRGRKPVSAWSPPISRRWMRSTKTRSASMCATQAACRSRRWRR